MQQTQPPSPSPAPSSEQKIGKIEVKRDLCIGAGTCVAAAPSVFQLDDQNKALIISKTGATQNPVSRADLKDPQVSDETLKAAATSCPTQAIALYDEVGKQIYP